MVDKNCSKFYEQFERNIKNNNKKNLKKRRIADRFLPLAALSGDLRRVAALRGFANTVEFLRAHFVVNNVFYPQIQLGDYSL